MTRKIDTFAKYSESVMGLLLPETDLKQAIPLANRIRTQVASQPVTTLGSAPYAKLTVSVGVASFPSCVTLNDLVGEATRNLQAAQENGATRS